MSEKKEENKEPIKPMLIVPWMDKYGHAVIKTISREDADTLNAALDSPGVLVQGPTEEDKVCPSEPDKPYEESICKKIDELFKKVKKGKEKESETKQKISNTNSQGCICSDF